jgi:hypothetical protein
MKVGYCISRHLQELKKVKIAIKSTILVSIEVAEVIMKLRQGENDIIQMLQEGFAIPRQRASAYAETTAEAAAWRTLIDKIEASYQE